MYCLLIGGWFQREREKEREGFRKGIVESSGEKREANVTRWMEEGQAKIKKDRGISRNGGWKGIPMKFKCRRRVFRGGQGKRLAEWKESGVGPCERRDRSKEGETERRKAWWWCRSATQALSLADLHVSVLNYPVPTAPVTLFSLRNSSWTPNTI